MKVIVVSYLHYNRRVYRGVDESKAWVWLLDIVNCHRPDPLIFLGD